MPNGGKKPAGSRKKLKMAPNISQRSTGKNVTGTNSKRPAAEVQDALTPAKTRRTNLSSSSSKTQASLLPEQYLTPPQNQGPHVGDFPPPAGLLQPSNSFTQPTTSLHQRTTSLHQRTNSLPRGPNNDHRASPLLQNQTENPLSNSIPEEEAEDSPVQNSQAQSHPSSHGHNFEDDEELLDIPELQEDTLRALNALLRVPNREKFVPLLHPDEKTPNSTWYCSATSFSSYLLFDFCYCLLLVDPKLFYCFEMICVSFFCLLGE